MFEQSRHGAVNVIKANQPLSGDAVDQFSEIMQELILAGQPMIVFDMSDIPLVDSRGLEILLEMKDNCDRRGGNLNIAAANPLCSDIFELTGVGDRFEMYAGVSEAVGSFIK